MQTLLQTHAEHQRHSVRASPNRNGTERNGTELWPKPDHLIFTLRLVAGLSPTIPLSPIPYVLVSLDWKLSFGNYDSYLRTDFRHFSCLSFKLENNWRNCYYLRKFVHWLGILIPVQCSADKAHFLAKTSPNIMALRGTMHWLWLCTVWPCTPHVNYLQRQFPNWRRIEKRNS